MGREENVGVPSQTGQTDKMDAKQPIPDCFYWCVRVARDDSNVKSNILFCDWSRSSFAFMIR